MSLNITETVHPHDPDAYEVRWEHDAHEHFLVVPRELMAESRAWVARHADRINEACARMFAQAGGDGRA